MNINEGELKKIYSDRDKYFHERNAAIAFIKRITFNKAHRCDCCGIWMQESEQNMVLVKDKFGEVVQPPTYPGLIICAPCAKMKRRAHEPMTPEEIIQQAGVEGMADVYRKISKEVDDEENAG